MAYSTDCPPDSTSADRATGSDIHSGRVIGLTDEFSGDHWIVPARGLTPADPAGTLEAIAHRDGSEPEPHHLPSATASPHHHFRLLRYGHEYS